MSFGLFFLVAVVGEGWTSLLLWSVVAVRFREAFFFRDGAFLYFGEHFLVAPQCRNGMNWRARSG